MHLLHAEALETRVARDADDVVVERSEAREALATDRALIERCHLFVSVCGAQPRVGKPQGCAALPVGLGLDYGHAHYEADVGASRLYAE
jgi:hypothetical protein